MFHFTGLPPLARRLVFYEAGYPIRESAVLGMLAPPRGFSQLATPFFGHKRQGIPRVPLIPLPLAAATVVKMLRVLYTLQVRRRRDNYGAP